MTNVLNETEGARGLALERSVGHERLRVRPGAATRFVSGWPRTASTTICRLPSSSPVRSQTATTSP